MNDDLKALLRRIPVSVISAAFIILLVLVAADDEARHAVAMGIAHMTANNIDWAQTALISVLAWIGQNVHRKLDDLTIEVKHLNTTMTDMDRDLREDINNVATKSRELDSHISERVTKLEERCDSFAENRASTCPHIATSGLRGTQ